MENQEGILHALQEFDSMSEKVVSPELEQLLCFIAKTGLITYPWSLLKPLFKVKLDKVMRDFFEGSPARNGNSTQPTQLAEFEVMRQRLLDCLEAFDSAPFTVQRLCELMVEPRKHYRNSEKFMRGVEKNVLVVSTIDASLGFPEDHQTNNNDSHAIPSLVQNTVGMPNGILSEDEHIHANSNGNHHHVDILGRPSPLNSFLDNDNTLIASQVTQDETTDHFETRTNALASSETSALLDNSPAQAALNTQRLEPVIRLAEAESDDTEDALETTSNVQTSQEENSEQPASVGSLDRQEQEQADDRITESGEQSNDEMSARETSQSSNHTQDECPCDSQQETQADSFSDIQSNEETEKPVAEEPMEQD